MSGVSSADGDQSSGTSTAGQPVRDRTNRRAPGRDRYLDLLRAIALARVVAFHTFGGAVFALIFPSMGVMFALAGSLMARSLERPALGVLAGRTRRLLLPLWVYSLTVLVLLFVHGWRPGQTGNGSLQPLLPWFVPLAHPLYPPSLGGEDAFLAATWPESASGILWYIVAYFWFMLLSPLLLKAYKARPLLSLFAPLALMACLAPGLVPLPAGTGATITNFAMYGSCWMLGFAYEAGHLRGVPARVVFTAGPALMGLGFWLAAADQGVTGWDVSINGTPLGGALWAFGFSAMLLRISPSWKELPRPIRFLDRFVTLVNNRAMTVYLWHNILIVLIAALRNPLYSVEAVREHAPWLLWEKWPLYLAVWVALGVVCLGVGWVEDVSARRPARLWPDGSRREPRVRRASSRRDGSASNGWMWMYPRSFRDSARVFLEPGAAVPPEPVVARRPGTTGPPTPG
ncbi:acyltransferase [Kocuria sp. M1R5S2]|uniref:acyltransferase family protein n=1 Tax=Kocuria rhizosphaerae TaxID=3376285 RepID=UPI00379947E6